MKKRKLILFKRDGKFSMKNEIGNIIIPAKYLAPFKFEDDFAIVHEGGQIMKGQHGSTYIVDSKSMIIDKNENIIFDGYTYIQRRGKNVFAFWKREGDNTVMQVKKLIKVANYVIALEQHLV